MTMVLAHLAFLAIVGPLVFFLARALPPSGQRRRSLFPLALIAAGALFFFLRPHEGILSGLDDMAYQLMAEAFENGTSLVHQEPAASITPADLPADTFRFRKTGGLRPSFNRYFQIGEDGRTAVPYFEPFYPLSAAGSPLPIHLFPSLLATIWFALLILCGFAKGGLPGSLIALLLFLATAWPAWFLRGHFAEGAAAVLVASVFLSHTVRPLKAPRHLAMAFFLLGLSITIHPTALLIAIPVGLSMVLFEENGRQRLASALGGLLGLVPLILLTRYVCHPYGDWTRLDKLRGIASVAVEHQAMIGGVLVLGLLCVMALAATWHPGFRKTADALDQRLGPIGWAFISLLPPALLVLLPFSQAEAIRRGFTSTWTGIGLPCLLLWTLAGWMVVRDSRASDPARRTSTGAARLLLLLLCWITPAFLLVKGVETPVGLWSQRRFLPIALLLTSLFSSSLATLPLQRAAVPLPRGLVMVFLLACSLFNFVRGADGYLLVNERGSRLWRDELAGVLEKCGLVLFDYHPHSVPFTTRPAPVVLGLANHARPAWPRIERWLAGVAATGRVAIATSWTPSPVLETDVSLRPFPTGSAKGNRFETRYPVLVTKGFFPLERQRRTVSVSLFSLRPNETLAVLSQDKFLDGSPIGLRGPWGKMRNATTWTRQGSAIVGPVTNRGTIVVTLDAIWPDHPSIKTQTMTLTPPWGEGGAISFQVATQKDGVQPPPIVLELPAPANASGRTGLYRFSSPTPYDPAVDGLRGYDNDLGIVLRRIRIDTSDD